MLLASLVSSITKIFVECLLKKRYLYNTSLLICSGLHVTPNLIPASFRCLEEERAEKVGAF
jgi:hypothetical protein